jgi:CRISPR-associated protein Cas1
MKKLGNTVYILTDGNYLHCENDSIAIKTHDGETKHIPAHTIEQIVCLGNTTVSTPFIGFCGEHGISLSFHSENGRFYGRIYGKVTGNVLLRKAQFENLNTSIAINTVRNILIGKLANSRFLLLKNGGNANEENREKLKRAAELLSDQSKKLMESDNIDSMRGLEGTSANIYFSVFDNMIKSDNDEMKFVRRSHRPPENRCNAIMSFLYMLLKNDVQSALESVGLDTAVGYMHTLRPGRPSLALDIMEEMRAVMCDRLCISMINLKQIQENDFDTANGEYRLKDKARRLVADEWQKSKKSEIIHPFMKEKITVGLIPYSQAMLFARVLRGDLDEYPPFVWRL